MISGIVDSVSGQYAFVVVKGESSRREYPYKFGKGKSVTQGDEVVIGDVDGAKRILEVY